MSTDKTPLARPAFASIRQIGMGGLHVKNDPQDLQDNESPDLRNIVFDSGIVGPRQGTTLLLAVPQGESGTPTQLLKAKDSNGVIYIIAVYGNNFYLFNPNQDPDQSQTYDADYYTYGTPTWIKISPSALPTATGRYYGSVSWNLGTGTDSFYFGNAVDPVMKWVPMLTYLKNAALSSDTQITVVDSTLFALGALSLTVLINGNAVTLTNNSTGASIVLAANPTNGQTLTLDINGTTVTINFVSAIGVAAGNVLIGSSLADTIGNLLGLLNSPGTTNSTQVALSAPNQALVEDFTYTQLSSASLAITPNASVTSLVVGGTSTPAITYTNPNNVITVSGTVGTALPIGATITNQIVTVPTIPRGNRFARSMASGGGYRMFVAGVPANENLLYYSQAYDPTSPSSQQESFSGGSGTLTSGNMPIIDGEGGIEDIVDFGQYLGILKANALIQGYFNIDTTDDTISFNTNPTIYGESIFPIGAHEYPLSAVNLTVENSLYIPTVAQGIYSYVPASTGAQLSTTITPFSDDILPLFTEGMLSFAWGRAEFFNRKLLYLCSSIGNINNLVLVYDFAYGVWTLWDNLNAVDIKESNGRLLFLCNDDGGLYYFDSTSAQDFRNGQAVGFTTYLFTKRYDWGKPANPKQESIALIQGYITQNTKLYVDVLYNENGSLAAQTFEIDGGNTNYVDQIPLYTPGRVSLGQNPIGGAQTGTIGVFRVYLDLLFGAGAHIIQFKIYSTNVGDSWGLTGLAVNPELNEIIPTRLKLGIV